jgi:outer membrane lipoprotein-sorting protein
MLAWSEGMEKTLIKITAPRRERGVGTLRTGNDMWNYLPKINKAIKIPPSMMMSSWMGSDFNNDDLVKEFSLYEDYTYELIEPEDAVDSLVYVNCIPREDLPVVWGRVVIAATKASHLPVWQMYYDEDGKLLRELHYSDVQTFDGRTIPATMEMIPHTKEGHRTIIRYLKLEFDIPFDNQFFTQRKLRAPL